MSYTITLTVSEYDALKDRIAALEAELAMVHEQYACYRESAGASISGVVAENEALTARCAVLGAGLAHYTMLAEKATDLCAVLEGALFAAQQTAFTEGLARQKAEEALRGICDMGYHEPAECADIARAALAPEVPRAE